MDEKIGHISASSTAAGLKEDTIIVFQSDHGHSTEVCTFGGVAAPALGHGANSARLRAAHTCYHSLVRETAGKRHPGQLVTSSRLVSNHRSLWHPSAQADRWQESKTHPFIG